MTSKDKTFWVTNISDRNVSLSDLNLTIRANSSVNLLDKKHYSLTEEQLNKSLESGSIFTKKDKIKKRIVPPVIEQEKRMTMDYNSALPSKTYSIYEIKQEKYEELEISDDEFAEQNIELSELDRQPLITKDK